MKLLNARTLDALVLLLPLESSCGPSKAFDVAFRGDAVVFADGRSMPAEPDSIRSSLGKVEGPILRALFEPDAPYSTWLRLQEAVLEDPRISIVQVHLAGSKGPLSFSRAALEPKAGRTVTQPLRLDRVVWYLCAASDETSLQEHVGSFREHQARVERRRDRSRASSRTCCFQIELAFDSRVTRGTFWGKEETRGEFRAFLERALDGIELLRRSGGPTEDDPIPLVLVPDGRVAIAFFWEIWSVCRRRGIPVEEGGQMPWGIR
jgi:hypothetical protein